METEILTGKERIHSATGSTQQERMLIDRSCRFPVLVMFASAIGWLVLSSILGLTSSVKLHVPEFLDGVCPIFSYGRLWPAFLNALVYGWASMAGMGVAVWLIARLCRVPVAYGRLILTSAILWNVGVAAGVWSILIGKGTSLQWLDFYGPAAGILLLSYAFLAAWVVKTFLDRKPGHIFASLWFLVAALFWFPWLYATANLMLVWEPVNGSAQAIVHAWYGGGLMWLWLAPLALGAAYYFIPKITGRPIYSYAYSILGFWVLAIAGGWSGTAQLAGGPVPAWLVSTGIMASVLMLIPVMTVAVNHHMTMKGHFDKCLVSPTLRFSVSGSFCFTVVCVFGALMTFRSLGSSMHFTYIRIGQFYLMLYAFYSMCIFGAIYYIVPRLTGWEWPSASLIKIHYWAFGFGSVGIAFFLCAAGSLQGKALGIPETSFISIVEETTMWLRARTLSELLLVVGVFAFALQFVLMLLRLGEKKGKPTLFA